MSAIPTVSIGLPVYNGEKFLPQALDALLAQSFGDFELIIADNGSIDATAQICRDYAARDPRIRIVRSETNVGAAANFNRTVDLARGKYFKWAAHDDLLAATLLQRCVEALDADDSAILAFPRRQHISYDGTRQIGTSLQTPRGASVEAEQQSMVDWPYGDDICDVTFAQLLRLPLSWAPMFVFGLIRSDALRKTRLIGAFGGSDVVLVLELRMLGPFAAVREDLYFQRLHPANAWTMRRNRDEEAAWFKPTARRSILPRRAHLYVECMRSIYNAQIAVSAKAGRYRDLADRWLEALWRRLPLHRPSAT